MDEIFLKPYNPNEHEENIYKQWEDSGYFNPDNLPGKRTETYSIVLPPPNVTGTLHMGHAAMLAVEDILIRTARMQGKETLWLPGTDSAAIATQSKVEKEIYKKEKRNRHDIGREELLSRINEFTEESKSTIINQVKHMGSSLDWSRYAYTLDEQRYDAVMEAFVRMYDAGLIYRGTRVINWDPKGQTTISDDEIVYEEGKGKLYTFKYAKDFPISISTTRPETKVGDTAVAVHPDDERYKEYIGKEYDVEFAGTQLHIRIVSSKEVSPEYGTGALGVTPAHSKTDEDIAKAHDLPSIQVISEYAKMTDEAGPLVAGQKVKDARETVVEWLRTEGLLEKEEEVDQNISTAERTGAVIEPLPKLQWFIDVNKKIPERGNKSLKELMKESVASGAVSILPERFERIYFNWIENLHDWCISRQIWFGHRIPVWYHENKCIPIPGREAEVSKCEMTVVSKTKPVCKHCKAEYTQDPDTLDTWFSSGLWTFSTLGWPEETEDLKRFHPTSVLETGYDIIFFWVARMILMSQFFLGEVPFKNVYLHGLVRDEKGRKMSKSLGNIMDPLDMIEKFGADATRLSLIVGAAPGNDIKLSENRVKGYKHFANKIWNASRFVLENIEGADLSEKPELLPEHQKHLDELNETVTALTDELERYRLDLAAERAYHYFWHTFADVIIEECKSALQGDDEKAKKSAQWLLYTILATSLKLLHPFMPFVTETIWQHFPEGKLKTQDFLMVESWPTA